MRGLKRKSAVLAIGILTLCGTGALAAVVPTDRSLNISPRTYPGAPKPVYDDPRPPYAMNYADEAAQSLGVRNGHMDLFSSKPVDNDPLVPVVSGGLGGDGAMLRLQWHPGL